MTAGAIDTRGLIGGIGLTHLRVYDQRPGPDGVMAGCAHIHALSDEAYLGISGSGAIELHDPVSGFRTVPIRAGTFVQFPAGTLHRSVSHDRLEVVVVMGSAGLPERGDARIYFGRSVDEDPAQYVRLRDLAAEGLEGALARRDASAAAYARLLDLWARDRAAYVAELERFLAVHRSELAARRAALDAAVASGPEAAARTVRQRLDQLPAGEAHARAWRFEALSAPARFGMCGILHQIETSAAV